MLISVIMGVYNCEKTLPDAIESILKQTYTNWELIMCDDGSNDATFDVAKHYQMLYPQKIIILKNEKNIGLNSTLNNCLKIAKGKYIARMDGDDVCSPNRFEKEIEILENEPNIAIVSTAMSYFDEHGIWGQVNHKAYPCNKDFLHRTQFCHAPCMVRKEAYDAVGGYTESKWLLRVEDYHLWIKMYAAGYKGKNLQEPLYQMRDDRNAYLRRKFRYRINEVYVKFIAIKMLQLPCYSYLIAIKPILVGLLPPFIYNHLHKKKLQK